MITITHAPLLVTLVVVGLATPSPVNDDLPEFAQPVRLMAGQELMGAGRMYPSPVLHDVDGDGARDMVIGDLFGRVTVSPAMEGGSFGPGAPLEDKRGERLEFNNW